MDSSNLSNLEFLEISASTRSLHITVEWFRAIQQVSVPNKNWHAHSNTEIHFVKQGKLNFYTQNQCYEVGENQAILIPAKTTHRLENASTDSYFNFVINCRVMVLSETPEAVFVQNAIHTEKVTVFQMDGKMMQLLEDCVNEEMQHIYGFVSVIECNIALLLLQIARALSASPSAQYPIKEHMDIVNCRIDTILEYISNHPTIQLTVGKIASEIGLSVRQVQRIVKRQCNATVSELVDKACLQRAKELLKLSSLSTAGVALEVGFSCEQAFLRFFRRMEGDTPNSYRKGVAPLGRRRSKLLDDPSL